MSKHFSSDFVEREYLLSSPPSEVLNYLDKLNKEIPKGNDLFRSSPLNEVTTEALFNRNDKYIDLGLALIVDDKCLTKILDRNKDDPNILTAALSNKLAVAGIFSPGRWLQDRIDSIIKSGTDEHIKVLFSNEYIADEIIESSLLRKNSTKEIENSRYFQILWYLLNNPKVTEEPDDKIDYDMSQHSIVSATWNLLLSLPVTDPTISLLANSLIKFPEIYVPYEFTETLNIEETEDWKKKAVKSEKEFLKAIFIRWTKPNDSDSSGFDVSRFNCDQIRKIVVTKINPFYLLDLEDFLLNQNDPNITQGFFSSLKDYDFSNIKFESIKKYYEKYGKDFLIGFINGDQIFLKSNKTISKEIYSLISNHKDPVNSDEWDKVHFLYRRRLEYLQEQKNSEKYINDVSDFYEEEIKDTDEIQTQDDINRKIKNLREKINSSTESTENLVTQKIELLSKQLDLLSQKVEIFNVNTDTTYNKIMKEFSIIRSSLDKSKEKIRWIYIIAIIGVIYFISK